MSETKTEEIKYYEEMKYSSASKKMERLDAYNLGSNMDILGIVGDLSNKYLNYTDLKLFFSDRIAPLKKYIGELYEFCDDIDKEILKDAIVMLSRPKGIFPIAFGYELQRIFINNEDLLEEVENSEITVLEQ